MPAATASSRPAKPARKPRKPRETLRNATLDCRATIRLKASSEDEAFNILSGIFAGPRRLKVQTEDGIILLLSLR